MPRGSLGKADCQVSCPAAQCGFGHTRKMALFSRGASLGCSCILQLNKSTVSQPQLDMTTRDCNPSTPEDLETGDLKFKFIFSHISIKFKAGLGYRRLGLLKNGSPVYV